MAYQHRRQVTRPRFQPSLSHLVSRTTPIHTGRKRIRVEQEFVRAHTVSCCSPLDDALQRHCVGSEAVIIEYEDRCDKNRAVGCIEYRIGILWRDHAV